MDACCAVDREVDRVLSKFGVINEQASRTLYDLISYIESFKSELEAGK